MCNMRATNTPGDLPPPYSSLGFADTNVTVRAHGAGDEARLLEDNYLFEDKSTRIGFIQKVLATKLLQLLAMCAVMAVFVANHWAVIRFMDRENNHVYLIVASNVAYVLIFLLLVCCHATRQNLYRYIFLVIYPLSLSTFLCIATVYWEILAPILLSFIYYCVVVFVLLMYSIYACQTNLEFVTKYGIIVSIVTQFVMYAATVPFLNMDPMIVLCPTVILLLEYTYLLYDIEAMTSKNYWNDIKPDNFIKGALILNIDYFNILYNSKMCSAFKERVTRIDEFNNV